MSVILFYLDKCTGLSILECGATYFPDAILHGLYTVIPVAITAIYPSKQGVLDLGYTRAHVSFHL